MALTRILALLTQCIENTTLRAGCCKLHGRYAPTIRKRVLWLTILNTVNDLSLQ